MATGAIIGGAALVAGGVAAKGSTASSSKQDQRIAERQLRDLYATPKARYGITPEIKRGYSQAYGEASNPQGYTGAQTNTFRNQLGELLKTRFANATNASGGSGAKAINATLAGQETGAINNFAANDPSQSNKRYALGRMDRFAGNYQDVATRNAQEDINYRTMTERALGNAIASQKNYRRQMWSSLGSQLIGVGGQVMGKGMGSTGGGGQ